MQMGFLWRLGAKPEAPINEELSAIYKIVNPVCRVCANNGNKPVASAVKKSAHKAKK